MCLDMQHTEESKFILPEGKYIVALPLIGI
jgi:hypothetical protein